MGPKTAYTPVTDPQSEDPKTSLLSPCTLALVPPPRSLILSFHQIYQGLNWLLWPHLIRLSLFLQLHQHDHSLLASQFHCGLWTHGISLGLPRAPLWMSILLALRDPLLRCLVHVCLMVLLLCHCHLETGPPPQNISITSSHLDFCYVGQQLL